MVADGERDEIFIFYLENCWKDPVALQGQWIVIRRLNCSELSFVPIFQEVELPQILKAMAWKGVLPPGDRD